MFVCMHACACVCACMRMCVCVCVCVCVYAGRGKGGWMGEKRWGRGRGATVCWWIETDRHRWVHIKI